jgi:hypothetical protein
MRSILSGLYVLLVGAVFSAAAYAWSLRCEGFGCTGVGIVWAMWAGLCGVATVLGLILRSFLAQQPTLRRAVNWAWGPQSVLGLVLLGYWFLKQIVRAI